MRQKAEELAKIMGKKTFTVTNRWFKRWKNQAKIV
jgi:hypothetical protein